MSNFRMSFSGDVRKPQVKEIGGKPCVEFQLMKKNYSKPDAEATFTWLRVTCFDVKPWQITQCQEGRFVAGTGEFTLRSYEKDGQKRQSAEIRCSSFDLDGPRAEEQAPTVVAPAARAPSKPAPATAPTDDEPPW